MRSLFLFYSEHGMFQIGLLVQFQLFVDIQQYVLVGGPAAEFVGGAVNDHEVLRESPFSPVTMDTYEEGNRESI